MGKGAAKEAQRIETAAANQFMDTSKEYLGHAGTALKTARDAWTPIAQGDRQAAQTVLAPQIEATRSEFAKAGEQLERTLPRGGFMDQAKANLAQGEAGAVNNLFTTQVNEALARLASLGTFQTQAGISSGYGAATAGGHLGNMAAGKAQGVGSGVSGIAQSLGMLAGGGGGGIGGKGGGSSGSGNSNWVNNATAYGAFGG